MNRFEWDGGDIEVISRPKAGVKGGSGSGNFGHIGRPGAVGGSVGGNEPAISIGSDARVTGEVRPDIAEAMRQGLALTRNWPELLRLENKYGSVPVVAGANIEGHSGYTVGLYHHGLDEFIALLAAKKVEEPTLLDPHFWANSYAHEYAHKVEARAGRSREVDDSWGAYATDYKQHLLTYSNVIGPLPSDRSPEKPNGADISWYSLSSRSEGFAEAVSRVVDPAYDGSNLTPAAKSYLSTVRASLR